MDIAKLLEPLSGDSPTGNDLRYVDGDLTFQNLNELRQDEDPALVVEGDAKTANWPGLVRQCEEALASQTKDLEIAAFLAEGLAHTDGFPGVRDGLRLVRELLQAFWDQLHPGFEDGEIILPIRAKPLAWLSNPRCFLPAVKSVPIATGHAARPLSWADQETARRVDEASANNPEQHQELTAAGHVGVEGWNLAIANTALPQLQEVLGSVRECAAEVEALTKVCNERFGESEAPGFTELDNLLTEIREHLQRKLEGTAESGEGEELEQGAAAAAPTASGPIRTRKDALRQLDQVAAFFRQTEPHSPISYLVQRAVRWGGMPLEEVLKEVVKDSGALDRIWDTLGIRPPDDE